VKLRSQRLADQTVNSIANLVASAWENLSPDDVTIVSADGRLPLTAGKLSDGGLRRGLADPETLTAERIVDTLAPVVGAEHLKSSVTIEYNPDSGETTQELYDPNATAILTSQTSQDQTSSAPAMGIPGTPSNVPIATQAPATAAASTPAVPPAQPNPASPNTASANGAQTAGIAATPAKGAVLTQGTMSESKTFAVSKTTHRVIEPRDKLSI
jgi:flagellar M-ring protein FliF